MAVIEHSVEIERPCHAVWAVLESVRELPRVSPSTVDVRDAPPRLSAPGDTFTQVVSVMGRRQESEWTVVDLEPDRRLVIEGTASRAGRYCMAEYVEELGPSRCRLVMRITYELPFGMVGRLVERLGVERRARQESAEVLANIRARVETDAV